ncbi:hypothetical protein F0562_012091 [Nyssa sinensis]|uniref:Calmodulin-binding domain-containing protein n=1 Tax=Nyssa sinensis TaxID=561372 RepID=A0A5J4ZWF1_9ASTE|nr:hypothetical protein F0562_012091 [Nyssa sinensis]
MATSAKDIGRGKEKRGISPSNSNPRQNQKHVPNYLKPTISSRLDTSTSVQYGKTKQQVSNNVNIVQSPNTLSRRRSFDKPPSPSQLQKSLTSIPGDRNLGVSPVPVLPRSTALPKPHPERLSKTPRETGKPHSSSYARTVPVINTVKKSPNTNNIKKQSNATTSTTIATTTKAPLRSPEVDNIPRQEGQESSVTEVEEEVTKVEIGDELTFEISTLILEDKEQVDLVQAGEVDQNSEEDEELKPCESSYVFDDQDQIASLDFRMEEPIEKSHVEETIDNRDEGEEEHRKLDETDKSYFPKEEIFAVHELKLEGEDTEGGKGIATENFEGVSNEGDEVEGTAKEAKPEADNVAVKPHQQESKKDSPAYNDVIEETASKLLEKRKNKVKALVGAFETVISLQEPEA